MKPDVSRGDGSHDQEHIEYIVRTLVEHFRPRRILVFGSRARGDAAPDSDLDLYVEMETTKPPPERIMEVHAVFGLRRWPLDVVVYTPDEVERLRGMNGTLLSIIEAEGRTLYERP